MMQSMISIQTLACLNKGELTATTLRLIHALCAATLNCARLLHLASWVACSCRDRS